MDLSFAITKKCRSATEEAKNHPEGAWHFFGLKWFHSLPCIIIHSMFSKVSYTEFNDTNSSKNKYKSKVEDDFDESLEEDSTPTVGSPASIKQRKAEEGRQGGVEMI